MTCNSFQSIIDEIHGFSLISRDDIKEGDYDSAIEAAQEVNNLSVDLINTIIECRNTFQIPNIID